MSSINLINIDDDAEFLELGTNKISKTDVINCIDNYIMFYDQLNKVDDRYHKLIDKIYDEYIKEVLTMPLIGNESNDFNIKMLDDQHKQIINLKYLFRFESTKINLLMFNDIEYLIKKNYSKPNNCKNIGTLLVATSIQSIRNLIMKNGSLSLNDNNIILLIKLYCERKIKYYESQSDEESLKQYTEFYKQYFA